MDNECDFLTELNNLYNKPICGMSKNESSDVCLISLETLEDRYITLKCNHKYNLIPLFNFILQERYVYCPYCLQNINNTFPIRNINGVYIYNKKVNQPLEKCITNEHVCNTCGSSLGFNGTCIRHHRYFDYLREIFPDDKKQVVEKKINLIEHNFMRILNKNRDIAYHVLFDDFILDNLNVGLLKLLLKKYSLDKDIPITKSSKYELINYIKIFNNL